MVGVNLNFIVIEINQETHLDSLCITSLSVCIMKWYYLGYNWNLKWVYVFYSVCVLFKIFVYCSSTRDCESHVGLQHRGGSGGSVGL